MARTDWIAEVSLPCLFMLPMVGMAMSMRMRMMEMTISSSISVKPLGCLPPCAPGRPLQTENLGFMGFLCLVKQAGDARPLDKMLHRTDAEGKWNARKARADAYK